jgi:hypothetical protein
VIWNFQLSFDAIERKASLLPENAHLKRERKGKGTGDYLGMVQARVITRR